MTKTSTRRTAGYYAERIGSAQVAADTYQAMIDTLEPLRVAAQKYEAHMTIAQCYIVDELERLAQDRDEMLAEVDYQVEQAILAGYEPEDME